jgi:sarcosine oxidase/sarcosine oxidase subunit beta
VTKVLIVGGGIAGLSTAWALARRGVEVALFEQGPLPNPRCSSYDEHRITRHAYGRMEGYAHLMPEAFRVWERMWRDLGVSHYEACGATYLIRNDADLAEGGWLPGTQRSLDAMGIGWSDIPLDEAEQLYPMLRMEGLRRVIATEGAGMLFPVRILTDLVVHLSRLGVALHTGAPVEEIDPERGRLVCGGRTHEGDHIVVAAGAWAGRLVPALQRVAVPSRQAVVYLAPPPELADAWANAPCLLDTDIDSGVYALPPRRGTRLKIGDHRFSRSGDPDGDRIATAAELAAVYPSMHTVFRDIDRYTVLEPKACFYTVTDTEAFHVEPIGAAGVIVSACSGHGFKLGALMGELVARALTGEMAMAALPDLAGGRVLHPRWPEMSI